MKAFWRLIGDAVKLPNRYSNWKRAFPSCFIEITTNVGCPVVCKDCPQRTFVQAYKKDPTRPQMMAFSDFKRIIDSAPPRTKILFAGFSEPFRNPQCVDMIEYALKKYRVWVNTTLVGLRVEDYRRFKDHPNLETFTLHIPDADGATKLKIDDEYLSVLRFVVDNKPGGFGVSLHGSAEHPRISHIIRHSERRLIMDRAGHLDVDASIISDVFPDGRIRCGHLWLTNHRYGSGLVLPDGTTVVCCMDWSMDYIIGNAFSQSIPEMRRSEKYQLCLESCKNPNVESLCRRCAYAVYQDSLFSDPKRWFMERDWFRHLDLNVAKKSLTVSPPPFPPPSEGEGWGGGGKGHRG